MGLFVSKALAGEDSTVTAALRSAGVTVGEMPRALETAFENPEKSVVAIVVPRKEQSLVLVLIRQAGGGYRVADASQVEDSNFGKLGFPRSKYDRFKTCAVEWRPRADGWFNIMFHTHAWKSGQRYTSSEFLLFQSDGTPMFR